MIFNSLSIIFAVIVLILFYAIRPSWRMYILVLASIIYVFWLDRTGAAALLIITVVIYAAGLLSGTAFFRSREKLNTAMIRFFIFACVACLAILKYFSLHGDESLAGLTFVSSFVIPLGFSYYMFQAVSYLSDIHSGKASVEKNIFKMFLYLAWFPKLSSGPIERKADFDRQTDGLRTLRFYDPERMGTALTYIICGLFFKLMIADRIMIFADRVFDNYGSFGSVILILGSLAYTVQIYADFAGYSMVAVGTSLLFGIKLTDNFASPYLSQNITEFWRRWHISLSTFLRDYLYIPLGGNKKGDMRKIFNTLIVFILCGLWHGMSFGFLFWGLLHGIFSAFDSLIRKKGWERLRTGLTGRIITFVFVSFAWIFFRSSSLSAGIKYILYTLTNRLGQSRFSTDILGVSSSFNSTELTIFIVSVLIMILIDIYSYIKKAQFALLAIKWNPFFRYALLSLMVIAIVIFGKYGPDTSGALIYAQF